MFSGRLFPILFCLLTTAAWAETEEINRFLGALSPEEKAIAQLPFNSNERFNWDWTPGKRQGLPLQKMNGRQRELVLKGVESLLSPAGYRKVSQILDRERLLGALEKSPDYRNPDLYYATVFGSPGANERWGFRFEGHHLSLNFTLQGNQLLSCTPMMMGVNPALWKESRVLEKEAVLAHTLVQSLDQKQRKLALKRGVFGQFNYSLRAGSFTFPADRKLAPLKPSGIKSKELTEAQRQTLKAIATTYFENARADFVKPYLEALEHAFPAIEFSAQGTFDAEGSYWYRLAAPQFVIEHNAVQDKGNHIHSVWRDPQNDFSN